MNKTQAELEAMSDREFVDMLAAEHEDMERRVASGEDSPAVREFLSEQENFAEMREREEQEREERLNEYRAAYSDR